MQDFLESLIQNFKFEKLGQWEMVHIFIKQKLPSGSRGVSDVLDSKPRPVSLSDPGLRPHHTGTFSAQRGVRDRESQIRHHSARRECQGRAQSCRVIKRSRKLCL